MTYAEFANQKLDAQRRYGGGTLVCYISAEALEELGHEAYEVRRYENASVHRKFSIPPELHSDIIFRIEDRNDLRFEPLPDGDDLYLVYD